MSGCTVRVSGVEAKELDSMGKDVGTDVCGASVPTRYDIAGMSACWRRPLMRGEAIYPWPMGTPGGDGMCVRLVDGVPMLMDRAVS